MPFRKRRGLRSSRRNTGKAIRDTVRYCAEALEERLFLSTTISIANSSAIEPAPNGTVNMNFTATRTGDLTSQVTVGYTTVAGTAQPNTDFTPTTGTVTFATGSATATIAIPIFNDGVYNTSSLTFSVQLTGVTNVVGPPVTLATKQTFATGSSPISVTAADLNGDGKPDLIATNSISHTSNTVSVLLNTTAAGATTATFGAQQSFTTGSFPDSVIAADVNGDGEPDLIVANGSSNTVSVLVNTTAAGATIPSFAAQQTFATGIYPFSVTSADVNGDGKPDLIVANQSPANTLSVLLNTTATGATIPSFAAQQTFATGTNPHSVTAADVNGDGKPDLIVANAGSNTVSVLLNTTATGASTPSFAAQITFATGTEPQSVTAADVGDGQPDLIVANFLSGTLSVLLNSTPTGSTTPSFAAQQTFATSFSTYAVKAADMNGDGKPDLVATNLYSGTVSVLLNTTTAGAIALSFAAQQTFATGSSPIRMAVADVNGDGKPDLIVANNGIPTVSVLLNTTVLGSATVVPAFPQTTFADNAEPYSVTAADMNGDGKPDLIVANYFSNGTVSVLLNTTVPGATTPSFASQQTFATSNGAVSVTTADVNGDGKPDLVVAESVGSNTVSVLLNTTPAGAAIPSFAAQRTFAAGNTPRSATAADVNGDGKPDLIVANESGTVSVLLNTTAPGATIPSFATQQTFAAGNYPWSVTTADVNGDGKPDLIVANGESSHVSVLLNTTSPGATSPSFTAPQTFATGTYPRSVTAADVNGDGKLDLVVTNFRSGTVSVLLNTTATGATAGSFAPQQTFATGSYPFSVTASDVNGDGKPDLIVANKLSTVSVLLNATVTGATTPSFAAQQTFAIASVPRSVTASDVNGDGRPDVIVADGSVVSVLLNTPVTIATNTATGTIIDPAVFTPVINGDNPNGLYTAAGQPSNGVQRSMVEDVVYTFNLAVTIPNANNAFTIAVANNSGGAVPTTMIATSIADPNNNGIVDGKVWAVSLTGQADGVLASIANGEYTITINPNSVFSAADGTTPITGGRTDNFFRLFGDMSGQGVLTALDNARLKQALTTYNPAFDYTGNGTAIVALDNARFKQALSINFANDFSNMTFVPTI